MRLAAGILCCTYSACCRYHNYEMLNMVIFHLFINGIFFLTHSLSLSLSLSLLAAEHTKKTFERGGTGIIKEIKILLWKPGHRVHGRLSNRRPYFIPTPQRKICYGCDERKRTAFVGSQKVYGQVEEIYLHVVQEFV